MQQQQSNKKNTILASNPLVFKCFYFLYSNFKFPAVFLFTSFLTVVFVSYTVPCCCDVMLHAIRKPASTPSGGNTAQLKADSHPEAHRLLEGSYSTLISRRSLTSSRLLFSKWSRNTGREPLAGAAGFFVGFGASSFLGYGNGFFPIFFSLILASFPVFPPLLSAFLVALSIFLFVLSFFLTVLTLVATVTVSISSGSLAFGLIGFCFSSCSLATGCENTNIKQKY